VAVQQHDRRAATAVAHPEPNVIGNIDHAQIEPVEHDPIVAARAAQRSWLSESSGESRKTVDK
jgi:hypothetical protein